MVLSESANLEDISVTRKPRRSCVLFNQAILRFKSIPFAWIPKITWNKSGKKIDPSRPSDSLCLNTHPLVYHVSQWKKNKEPELNTNSNNLPPEVARSYYNRRLVCN